MHRSNPVLHKVLGCLFGLGVAYFAGAACLLRFGLSRMLFPPTPAVGEGVAKPAQRVTHGVQGDVLLRRYTEGRRACVIFFPGQHGMAAGYDFRFLGESGIAVWVLAYPGQDGAAGRTDLHDIVGDVAAAVRALDGACPAQQRVFVGVSLGATLAAHVAREVAPAGLVLVSAAPSLSTAISTRLRSHAWSAPLALLPISHIVPDDYRLDDALIAIRARSVLVFQGTADEQTPLPALREMLASLPGVTVVGVPGGTHSSSFFLSREAMARSILAMVDGRAPGVAGAPP
jgi:alpha-beta hydrolase superfamily lysophospholipase